MEPRSRRPLAVLVAAVALVAAACGGTETMRGTAPATVSRYGLAVRAPAGWDARIRRGAVEAASFPLAPDEPRWAVEAARRLARDDVLVQLFEEEQQRSPPLDLGAFPEVSAPPRLAPGDFESFDGITEDSRASGHGFARRTFQMSGRFFVLFVETGRDEPAPAALARLNQLLGSLRVERGDFFPGTVAPARFGARPGWFVGTSGPDEARASGELTTSWASTIPYGDEWNALPRRTLEHLPADGIVIWVTLSRNNRFPPRPEGDATFPARQPPFSLDDFDARSGWEGQVRDLPEYVLWATVDGEYDVDLRVYFGRPQPTAAMKASAQAMLDALELPDWGPWETRSPASTQRLARNGVSVSVPPGWDGRMLFRDPTGSHGVIFQVANFRLPSNEGFEPPHELPPGQEDPIKAMDGGDVLVTVEGDAPSGEPEPTRIGLDELRFLPARAARVPAGHALAERSFCRARRCVRVEVDFGRGPPPPALRDEVDEVLASLAF